MIHPVVYVTPLSHHRRYNLWLFALDKILLFFNWCFTPESNLVIRWPAIPILESYGSFKTFTISAYEFGTVSMCADEFFIC